MEILQADLEHSSEARPLEPAVPLGELETPALLVDRDRLVRNLDGMQALADRCGVRLRPHAKSHKSPALAREQLGRGASGLCVAKVSEAAVFLAHGVENLLVAYPVLGTKAQALAALAERRPGVEFAAVADSEVGLRDLGRAATRAGLTLGVWLKVDVGLHRVGLPPYDPRWEFLAKRARTQPGLRLRGLLTHAGHVYAAEPEDVAAIGTAEGREVAALAGRLSRAGFGPLEVGVGSTPTAVHAAAVEGVDELHAGVYVFGDRQQVMLGGMTPDDVSLTVLSTVVSRTAPGRWVIDAGSKTLASDKGAHGTDRLRGFGSVLGPAAHRRPAPGAPLPFTEREAEAGAKRAYAALPMLGRVSEEHGVIEHDTDFGAEPGDRVEIVPNHACPVVNLAEHLYLVEGEGNERRAVAVWPVAARGKVV